MASTASISEPLKLFFSKAETPLMVVPLGEVIASFSSPGCFSVANCNFHVPEIIWLINL